MGIEIINPKEVAFRNQKRTVVMNTRKLHAWLIYYEPGRGDEMHCHNGDQTFHMIAGECTMSFPDGGEVVMTPGMSALITGGSFYQLDNTGDGPMVMMGTRSGDKDSNQHILYSTRENIRAKKKAAREDATGGAGATGGGLDLGAAFETFPAPDARRGGKPPRRFPLYATNNGLLSPPAIR